ncbi:MAG: hypothetical protein CM15mP78_15250 [Candidatus Poseidoniales archaeon]|nr:MAG: hypothetical protein CM15mP78_15250 [Candidatus Poseidoniales archaeon]
MSDELTVSASDIEVDEAAAYFGATESSDVLHAMMAMPREQAMIQFFELLSDIVLRPGDFDFEAASERMQCEGGEIYYLVAGHLGLMSMPDPLLQAGFARFLWETTAADAGIADGDRAALERLADPMRMMKLFAVAHQTGSKDEVVNYINGFEGFLKNVGGSVPALVSISTEWMQPSTWQATCFPSPPLPVARLRPPRSTFPKRPASRRPWKRRRPLLRLRNRWLPPTSNLRPSLFRRRPHLNPHPPRRHQARWPSPPARWRSRRLHPSPRKRCRSTSRARSRLRKRRKMLFLERSVLNWSPNLSRFLRRKPPLKKPSS